MANITADLNIILKEKGALPVLKREYDLHAINSFLQEAYNIVWKSARGYMLHAKILTSP